MNITTNHIHTKVNFIWSEILGFSIDNDNENFFALGGSSMQAFEIVTRVNEAFKLNISIMDFFDNLTINNQVSLLSKLING